MMKNRRLIQRSVVGQAYKRLEEVREVDLDQEENISEKVDQLPLEVFQIIGRVVTFVELANDMEGEYNENK